MGATLHGRPNRRRGETEDEDTGALAIRRAGRHRSAHSEGDRWCDHGGPRVPEAGRWTGELRGLPATTRRPGPDAHGLRRDVRGARRGDTPDPRPPLAPRGP